MNVRVRYARMHLYMHTWDDAQHITLYKHMRMSTYTFRIGKCDTLLSNLTAGFTRGLKFT